MPFFELQHKDKHCQARTGIMHTDHGDIPTPIFMPVGTQAAVKTLDQADLEKLDAKIILGNTYHLHLRPGEDLIDSFGGLHKFMNWPRPILTDSGGFQVFSLGLQRDIKENKKALQHKNTSTLQHDNTATRQQNSTNNQKLVEIDEDGVTFRSHLDGSSHRFTPESATEIQHKIGADIIMAFDECTPDAANYDYTKEAMERTHRWARRCLDFHKENKSRHGYQQFLFGIIQGAKHRDLREESAKMIAEMGFDGIAIGGESIGYNMEATKQILDWVNPIIPENKPHYAMGIGLDPTDLLTVVEKGVDIFDCVAPTRLARHGMLFSSLPLPEGEIKEGVGAKNHRLNINNSKFAADKNPIDKTCACSTCQNYTRAYLHHLFAAGEISAMRLATIHNLHFLLNLMSEARKAIAEDKFMELKREWE